MNSLLSTTDLVIFFGSLLAVMLFGLFAGRKDTGTEGYFLAGKDARWWGVAGSIFGSNVSANHIAGMMGVGFAVGFAQSQFEITAIAGLFVTLLWISSSLQKDECLYLERILREKI